MQLSIFRITSSVSDRRAHEVLPTMDDTMPNRVQVARACHSLNASLW